MQRYDVVILGGAYSGASAATLLRRDRPDLSVLIVERAEAFDNKVGEATTEMSAMFMTRRLALWKHLEVEQLPKEGFRYWFKNDKVTGHADSSETGSFHRSNVLSFQLRRDALDEHILATAQEEGAELWRPARATEVELGEFDHKLTIERNGVAETIGCRWILDGTGRASFIGKKLGLIERNKEHPTAAVWARWKDVKHIDDFAARGAQGFAQRNVASRRLATNHYMAFGSWTWFIPHANGETSIGVVFDTRLQQLDRGKEMRREYLAFLRSHPAMSELIEGATLREEDLRTYSNLAYVTKQYMGQGWALMGDAAAFLDPYYSPGLDHCSFSVEATVEIVKAQTAGEEVGRRIEEHNEIFLRSYHRFFKAVFKDKYYYMGESDLASAAVLFDTALYYIFIVIPAYKLHKKFYWMPVLGPKVSFFAYRTMCLYNRRFKALALARRAAGEEGLRNDRRRVTLVFDLKFDPFHMLARGTKLWLFAELDGVRLALKRLFRRQPMPVPEVAGMPDPAEP
jgi:flavin-dependent dehydrogenase